MNSIIILAAGQGQRLKERQDKMLITIKGKPLVYYTISAFNDHPEVDQITIVSSKSNQKIIKEIVKKHRFTKVEKVVLGGLTRQKSLEKGLKSLKSAPTDVILVHNGANPLPSQLEVSQVIAETSEVGACIVGHYVKSTIKEVDDQHIVKTHDRKKLFAAETPQAATYKILNKAVENAKKAGLEATDEAMLFEAIGQKISYIEASENNFKITTQGDILRLKTILGDLPQDFRVGIGQDSHTFEKDKMGLTLGGLHLPKEPKLKANSDGDVILHAIFNAISQATGDHSLGFYADPMCEKGIKDSKKYLEVALKNMKKQGFALNSLGLMIEAQRPKIDPLTAKLKTSLAKILNLSARKIGITATSGEELTTFGQGLGIQCFAIVSLKKVD